VLKPVHTDPNLFCVREADWQRDQAAIRSVRHAVFVIEQAIPAALEWDGLDRDAGTYWPAVMQEDLSLPVA